MRGRAGPRTGPPLPECFPNSPREEQSELSPPVRCGWASWGSPGWAKICFLKVPEWLALLPECVCVELPMGTETSYTRLWHGTEVQKCHTLMLKKLEERKRKIPILQIQTQTD